MSKLEEEEEIITHYFKKGKIVKYNKSSQKIQKLVTTSFNLKNQKSQNILLKNGVRERRFLLVNNFSFFGDAPYKKSYTSTFPQIIALFIGFQIYLYEASLVLEMKYMIFIFIKILMLTLPNFLQTFS